jgi:hypothetical protein
MNSSAFVLDRNQIYVSVDARWTLHHNSGRGAWNGQRFTNDVRYVMLNYVCTRCTYIKNCEIR